MRGQSNHSSRFISRFLGSSYSQKRLGEVANVFSGKTINLELENEGGPIAYLKVADLNLPENDRVVTTSSRFVTEETARTSGLVPIGATIFPKNGAAALHNKKRITSVTTCVDMNTMAVYSTSNTVIPEYLYAYLESQDLAALTLVGAIPQIRAKDVQSLVIPVPPIREQEQYVAVMHQADKSKFTNFKSRFIEMFGTLDSPKVPVKRMIEVSNASGQYGLNASAVNYIEGRPRYIRITDICDDGSLNDDIKCSDIDDSTYSVNKGDVLFARTGATVGKTYLHRSGDACFAGYLIRYSFTEAVDPEYILAYTHSDTYYDWVLKSQKVGAQPNISASQYDNMPILIPGRKEQEAFLCLYRQADKSKYLS